MEITSDSILLYNVSAQLCSYHMDCSLGPARIIAHFRDGSSDDTRGVEPGACVHPKSEVLSWRKPVRRAAGMLAVRAQLEHRDLCCCLTLLSGPPGSVSISVDHWDKTKVSRAQDVKPRGREAVHGRRPQAQERYQGDFLRLSESYLIVGFMPSARGLSLRVRLRSRPHVASPGSLGHVSPA